MATLTKAQRAVLEANPWFAALPRAVREGVVAAGTLRSVPDRGQLYARGEPPDGWYGIVKGAIKVGAVSTEGKESALTFLEPGTWFGEISLLDGLPRTHDGFAHGDCEILVVAPTSFHRLLANHPPLLMHLLKLQCHRLRLLFAALEEAQTLPLPARLAKQLIGLSRRYGVVTPEGVELSLRLPQEDLAQLLGASRQRINQELKTWERSGWIAVRYGRVTILDVEALERAAIDFEPM